MPNRFLVSLFLISVGFVTLSGGRVNADPFEHPMTFDNVCLGNAYESCYITAVGRITAETPEDFQRYLNTQYPEGGKIIFHSPGGNLLGGIELGRAIRKRKLSSEIGTLLKAEHPLKEKVNNGICASSCAYAFIGGVDRFVEDGNKYGVHQFYENKVFAERTIQILEAALPKAVSAAQIVAGVLAGYLTDMGADARLLELAGSAASDKIAFLDHDQLVRFRVVTPVGFSSWQIEAYGKGAVGFSKKQHQSGPYDQVVQVNVFCRTARKERFIQMIVDDAASSLFDRTTSEYSGKIMIEKSKISKTHIIGEDNIRIMKRVAGGSITFKIPDQASIDITQADEINIRLDAPRAAGGYHAHLPLSAQDRRTIALALSVCV